MPASFNEFNIGEIRTAFPNLTLGAADTVTLSPARTPAFFMASFDMPMAAESLFPSDKAATSVSLKTATLAIVFFPRFPLMETVSPSNSPISIMAFSVIPTTEWPSSPEYLKTCIALRSFDPPKIATDKSTSSVSDVDFCFPVDFLLAAAVVFFFFFDFLVGSSSTTVAPPRVVIPANHPFCLDTTLVVAAISTPYFCANDDCELKKVAASVVDTNAKNTDAAGNLIVLAL
mmetsp:Transcript_28474/g.77103  ORF Transcript_28474/g.77103 Transcript_28474/m.77103 type:complete len:231 (-) Transcript_28474:111-803(-)